MVESKLAKTAQIEVWLKRIRSVTLLFFLEKFLDFCLFAFVVLAVLLCCGVTWYRFYIWKIFFLILRMGEVAVKICVFLLSFYFSYLFMSCIDCNRKSRNNVKIQNRCLFDSFAKVRCVAELRILSRFCKIIITHKCIDKGLVKYMSLWLFLGIYRCVYILICVAVIIRNN